MKNALKKKIVERYRKFYSKGTESYYAKGKLIDESIIEKEMKSHKTIAKNIISNIGKKKYLAILDVGSGFGDLAFCLARYANSVFGVEPNKEEVAIAKLKSKFFGIKDVDFKIGYAEKLPFGDSSFDLITSKTVLEHVKSLEKTFSESRRVLKRGGLFYIEGPNYMWIKEGHYGIYMIPMMPKPLFKVYAWILRKDPSFIDEINYITPKKIRKYAEKYGFSVEHDISISILEEILVKKNFKKIPKHYRKIGFFIKVLSLVGLNRLFFWVIKKAGFYPSIIMVLKKKDLER